ncbi:MAG: DUF1996 domain-containing protein [Acidimicrobiales bacterium]
MRWASRLLGPAVTLAALLPAAALTWVVAADQEDPPPGPDAVAVAEQGRPVDQPNGRFFATGPQFAVDCGLARQASFDPIVHPGVADAGHRHDFFGSVAVDESSTGPDLLGSETTCRMQADTASYWAPSLLLDGVPVEPTGVSAYYRVAPAIDPLIVEPYPLGLLAIAGDGDATGPQDPAVAGYGCGRATVVEATAPTCPEESPLNLRVTFPDCWDGDRLDAPDHRSHLRYSGSDGCPASHPVPVPRLTLVVHYPFWGDPDGLSLASGALETAHADFLNGWDPDALRVEVRSCLHRQVVCAIPDPDRPGG